MNLDHYPMPQTNRNSKWIKDVHVGPETIKSPEENIGSNLLDTGLSDVFCRFDSKGKGNKCKNKQKRLHQTTKLLHS